LSFNSRFGILRKNIESGLSKVLVLFLIVFTLSILTYVADIESHIFNKYLLVNNILSASRETPWGIFTSLFTHISESHIINNMISLAFFLVILVVINAFLLKSEMNRRILMSSILMIFVPIISNLILILLFPEIKISGSSSIVYTVEGLCIGYSFCNSLKFRILLNHSRREEKPFVFFGINIIVFLSLFFNIILYPEFIFGFIQDYKLLIHTIPFYGGLICSLLILWFNKV
jgi:membrane associated rhomboid family serine protease